MRLTEKQIDDLFMQESVLEADVRSLEQAGDLSADDRKALERKRRHLSGIRTRLSTSQGRLTDPDPVGIDEAPGFLGSDTCGYDTPGEFLSDVIALGHGRACDRLTPLMAAAGSDEQGTYSEAYGGVMVPTGFVPNFLRLPPTSDVTMGLTTKVPMDRPEVTIPARVDKDHSTSVSGGLRVYRRAEADSVASSRMEMEGVTLKVTSLMGLCHVTEELIEDSALAFLSLLETSFRDEFAAKRNREFLTGLGGGEPLGILNSGALLTVAKESEQAAATLVYENVLKMRARCFGYENAVWIGNKSIIPQLGLLNQSVGTSGQVLWNTDAKTDIPDVLLGRPLYFSEELPVIGQAGDLVLCNWTQFLEGEYKPLRGDETIAVRFVEFERSLRFWVRSDGRPWWNAAHQPRNGSTESPFLQLAAR